MKKVEKELNSLSKRGQEKSNLRSVKLGKTRTDGKQEVPRREQRTRADGNWRTEEKL